MPRPFIVAVAVLAIVALAPELTRAQVGTPTPDFVIPDLRAEDPEDVPDLESSSDTL